MLPPTAAGDEARRLMAPAELVAVPASVPPAVPTAPSRLPGLAKPRAAQLKAWQREVATARAGVLHELERWSEEIGIEAARERLVAQSRAGDLPERLAELVRTANRARGHLSHTTLKRWRKQLQEGGFEALAPAARERGECVPAWGSVLLKLWSMPQKRALAAVLNDPEFLAALPEGVPPPSYGQARRFLASMSAVDRARGRMGPNALKSVRAFVRREAPERPGDVYVSDGHTFDAEVAHPRHGQPFRPELTCVIDWNTRMIVGWSAAIAESTWAVADALRHAVETHGIPAVYYADHGRGQENKTVCAMLARLGIREARSLPRNSQARGVIERFNQHLIAAAKRLLTYMGKDMDKDAANRVYRISRREIRLIGSSRLLLAWDDFLAFVADAIETYNTEHHHRSLPKLRDPDTGRVRHMTPAEAWQAAMADGWEPMLVGEEEAADLFRPYEQRKTHRGEIALHGKRYFHRDLEHLHGDEVLVGYDIHDPSKVWVRDLDDRLVAVAGLDANSHPAFAKSFIEQAREKRALGRLKRNEVERVEIIAELEGPAPTVDYDGGRTAEHRARLERRKVEASADASEPKRELIVELDGSYKDALYDRARRIQMRIEAGEPVSEEDRRFADRAEAEAWFGPRRRYELRLSAQALAS